MLLSLLPSLPFPGGPGGRRYSGRVPGGHHGPDSSHGLGSGSSPSVGSPPKPPQNGGARRAAHGLRIANSPCESPSHSRRPSGVCGNGGCPAPRPGVLQVTERRLWAPSGGTVPSGGTAFRPWPRTNLPAPCRPGASWKVSWRPRWKKVHCRAVPRIPPGLTPPPQSLRLAVSQASCVWEQLQPGRCSGSGDPNAAVV